MKQTLCVALVAWLLSSAPASAVTLTGQITGTATHGSAEFWQFYAPGETWVLQYTYDADGRTAGTYDVTLTAVAGSTPFIPPDAPATITIGRGGLVTGVSFSALGSPYTLIGLGWMFDRFGGGTLEATRPLVVSGGGDAQVLQASLGTLDVASVPDGGVGWLGLFSLLWLLKRSRRP